MSRLLKLLLVICIISSILPIEGRSAELPSEIINYNDGSYIVVDVQYIPSRATWSVTGNKQYTYYDNSNTAQWKAVLTGTFSYTGSSSSCTASSVDVTIYDSIWYVFTKSANKSGNTAKASVTMKRTYDGIPISVPISLTLSCDSSGNLS